MRPRHAAAAAALTAALAGCGSAATPARPGASNVSSTAAPTRIASPLSGAELFRSQCAACHTVGDPNSPHQGAGGDLTAFRLPRRDMLGFAREMPRVNGPRTEAQLEAIVAYVQRLQRAGAR